MYRFLLRPKWIVFHVVVLASAVGMVDLSRWQWHRHLERDAFVARVEERENAPATELLPRLAQEAPGAIEYSVVSVAGTYLADEQFTEILQVQGGVNGVNVVTPFQVDGGPVVIVNRGFVADGEPMPQPPTGTLVVGGLARTSEVRRTGELTDNNDGAKTTELRRIDLDLISQRLGTTVAPLYLDFIASNPPSPQPPAPPPPPDLSGGPPHVSYTIQWAIFSVCVLVGWVFAVRRSVRTRRLAAAKPSATSGAPIGALVTDDLVSAERPTQPSA
jgi:cytochrome oxidase assembly protein ShyY1